MPKSPNRAKKLLEVIHSDVCGPMETPTFSGKRYFVTFIDEYSHFCVVYLLRYKSEVAAKFAEFVAFAETQTGSRVRTLRVKQLRSDNGGEYKSREMAKFCSERGIVQKFTPPGGDGDVPPESVSDTLHHPRQVATPSMDGEETALGKPEGVWLPRLRDGPEGETYQI
ncbi:unnamed protein product [Phytophthora fragariaefolia]|uniref:Unnamed protein product n=1 Tax=Phytophthora fragariaefolia TaxID=1490495 RepID=A0A9W6YR91_9STRA|nr:unnamed protein product [Phytophthora fragariaefolia]